MIVFYIYNDNWIHLQKKSCPFAEWVRSSNLVAFARSWRFRTRCWIETHSYCFHYISSHRTLFDKHRSYIYLETLCYCVLLFKFWWSASWSLRSNIFPLHLGELLLCAKQWCALNEFNNWSNDLFRFRQCMYRLGGISAKRSLLHYIGSTWNLGMVWCGFCYLSTPKWTQWLQQIMVSDEMSRHSCCICCRCDCDWTIYRSSNWMLSLRSVRDFRTVYRATALLSVSPRGAAEKWTMEGSAYIPEQCLMACCVLMSVVPFSTDMSS